MSTLSYIAKNSSIRLIVYGIGIVSAFVVTPHILHSMGNSVYGIWILIVSLFPYFFICNFATSNAISTLTAKAKNDEKVMKALFVSSVQLGFLALVGVLFVALIFYSITDSSYTNYVSEIAFSMSLFTFALCIGLFYVINITHGFLAGNMRWTTLAFTSMSRTLIGSISVLFFLDTSLTANVNLLRMAYISSASFLFEACLNAFLAARYIKIPPFRDFLTNPFKSELFTMSKGLSVMTLGSVLRNSTQVYVINTFLSTASVTLFALVRQIINYMNDLLLSVFGIMGPYFSKLNSENDTQESQNVLLTSLFLSYGLCSIISLGLIFYGELFFIRWVGETFSDVQILLTPLALASLIELGAMPASSYLIGISRQNILAKLTILEGVSIVSISVPALLLYDLAGIGWVIFIVSVVFRLFWLPKKVCNISNIRLLHYYTNIIWVLFPLCSVQYIYYTTIKNNLTATYSSIILSAIGQTFVACLVLFTVIKLKTKLKLRPD